MRLDTMSLTLVTCAYKRTCTGPTACTGGQAQLALPSMRLVASLQIVTRHHALHDSVGLHPGEDASGAQPVLVVRPKGHRHPEDQSLLSKL